MDKRLLDFAEEALCRFRLYRKARRRALHAIALVPAVAGLWAMGLLTSPGPLPGRLALSGLVITLVLQLAIATPALIFWLHRLESTAAARRRYNPPRFCNGDVDWDAIESYVDLNEAAYYENVESLEAFLEGPMGRFIELCRESGHPRVSARILEFARGPLAVFKRRHARSMAAGQRVDDAVIAELRRRLGGDQTYLVDVLMGRRTHNG